MMRFRSLNSVLDECLAAMRAGDTIENCLARYPRHAERLRPLLMLAQRVFATPVTSPRPWAETNAWNAVRTRAAELRSGKRRRARSVNAGAWLARLAASLVIVLLMLGAAGGAAFAAQDTLPDSPLYRVKLAGEDVRLWFVFDEKHEAEILLDQSGQRMEEMMALVQRGKPIPENVLSDLRERNDRAAGILEGRPSDTDLRARMLAQAESQEHLLTALWPDVSESATEEYSHAVAALHNSRLQGSGEAVVSISPEDLSGGVLDISGLVEPAGDGLWRVGGVEVRIDERTIGYRDLQQGASARFVVARSSNGRLQALSVSTLGTDLSPSGSLVSGSIEQVTSQGIWVAGQFYPVTPETLLKLKLKEGERVELTLGNTSSGLAVTTVKPAPASAQSSEPGTFTYEGTVEGDIDKTNQWTIGGLRFLVTSATTVDAKAGNAQPGARVQVEAVNQNDELQARELTVLASEAPNDSAYLIGVFQGMKDGYWLVSGLEVAPPDGVPDPEEGATVAINARVKDGELSAVALAMTETPGRSDLVRFKGTILNIDNSTWTLEMGQVKVNSKAHVSGKPLVGARALGWAQLGRDGMQEAVYVRVLDQRAVVELPAPSPGPTPATD